MYVQVDKTLETEKLLKMLVDDLKKKTYQQEVFMKEFTAYSRWDKAEHERVFDELSSKSLKVKDMME